MEDPNAHQRARSDPAPDAQAPFPDRERTPPVGRNLVPARRQEVEPPADQPRREAPERDLLYQRRIATHISPATRRDRNRSHDRGDVRQSVGVDEQRPDMEPVRGWARDERVHTAMISTADSIASRMPLAGHHI